MPAEPGPLSARPDSAAQLAKAAVLPLIACALVLALLVLGALVPAVPVVGALGSRYVGQWALRFVLLGLLCCLLAVLARRCGSRRGATALGGGGAFALLGSLVVLGAQLSFAHDRGADLGPAELIGTGTPAAPPDRTEVYAEVGGTPLRASIWAPPTPGTDRPAVLWVHGGGFITGSRYEQRALYRNLADHGYPVISIDYRLAPPVRWRDATSDVVCALNWVTGHAGELGVDPSRVVLAGGSAGGSLSINAGYALADHDAVSSCGGAPPAPPIAVAGFYPAVDLAGAYDDNGVAGYARRVAISYLGGSPERYPQRYEYASALDRVRPGLMPTLLVTGCSDHLIFEDRVHGFAERLRAAGDQVVYAAFPFGEHAFDADFHSIGGAVSRAELLRFLDEHAPLR
ncbi:alpha/beta hydrolase [Saccharopolyspora sp. 6T]|uniref:alpha/beta hydrolase n=1 Tax=Saccharopolyspora sp. 6T TaxID=2877238 RepID=UPI001CD67D6F|nr:alpha/beta hydrolase [Saccharopolyspora sp. 6T]MCA1185298.1 alpha/beta hydrolase [Saccharopolyspora sp. 6T]